MGAKKRTRRAAEAAIAQIEDRRAEVVAELTAQVDHVAAAAARAHETLETALKATAAIAARAAQREQELDAIRDALTTTMSELQSHARRQVGELDRRRAIAATHLDEQCDAAIARLHTRLDGALAEFDDAIAARLAQVELRGREATALIDTSVPDEPPVDDGEPVDPAPIAWADAPVAESTPEVAAEHVAPRTTTTVATEAPVSAIAVHIDAAHLRSSLSHLARTAGDGWLRVDLVHTSTDGHPTACLRLVIHDVAGWWEHHDLPCRAPDFARRSAVFAVGELLDAVRYGHADHGTLTLEFGDDLTVGSTLVLASHASIPGLPGARRKVERIDLRHADRDGLVVDSQIGRLVVPSRLVSLLRSRRALDADLLTFDEQPCLVARVAGPSPDVAATITAPLTAEILDEMAPDRRVQQDSAVSQLLAAVSTNSTADELVDILRHGVGYARRRAAAHPNLPEGLIDAVLRDGTEAMRCAAASNPSISVASIERACADPEPAVRAAVARNRNVPPVGLVRLARDDDATVRRGVADNPHVSHELLAVLAGDRDPSVRTAVATHARSPEDALATLARDAYPEVCAAVAANPACPADLLDDLLAVAPEAVLSNPRVPEHLLVAASQVRSRTIRVAVASNPSTPPRQLQLLVRDPDPVVAAAVAQNPSASGSTRRRARRAAGRVDRATPATGSSETP